MRVDSLKWIRKSDRYLRSAELLLKDGDLDSAASRIYYAMFYCAEALLSTEGLSYSTHKGVISAFGEKFVKTGRMPTETHQWLREAFDQRMVGDYEWETDLSIHAIGDLLGQARLFRDKTMDYIQESGPPTAHEAPAIYLAGKPKPKRSRVEASSRDARIGGAGPIHLKARRKKKKQGR